MNAKPSVIEQSVAASEGGCHAGRDELRRPAAAAGRDGLSASPYAFLAGVSVAGSVASPRLDLGGNTRVEGIVADVSLASNVATIRRACAMASTRRGSRCLRSRRASRSIPST